MQSFNDLLASLDTRGNREAHLHSMLLRIEAHFKESVNKTRVDVTEVGSMSSSSPSSSLSTPNTNVSEFSSSFAIELAGSGNEMSNALNRYEDFEKWMWGDCLNLRAMKLENKRCEHLLEICDNCRDLSFFEDDQCSSCLKLCQTLFDRNLAFSKHISHFKEKLKWSASYFHFRESGLPVRFRLLKTQLALIEVHLQCLLFHAFSW